jgi:hypothetical protein
MITVSDERQRASDRANLAWAFVISIPLTLLLWAALILGFMVYNKTLRIPQEPPETVTSTSIVRIERVVPKPQNVPTQPHVQVVPKPVEVPAPAIHKALPTPETQPHELARLNPEATPEATPSRAHQQAASLSETLAQQNAAFQRETQQINANQAPLSNATIDPHNSPQAPQPYKMDYSGLPHSTGHGEGYISPTKSWHDPEFGDCYYGHYTYQYPDGGIEQGNIPWPFCYDPRIDPFRRGYPRMIPFPFPQPGYRVPAGTQLQRQEQEAYDYWLSEQP